MNQNDIGGIEIILLVNFKLNVKTLFILDSVVLQVLIMWLHIVFVRLLVFCSGVVCVNFSKILKEGFVRQGLLFFGGVRPE